MTDSCEAARVESQARLLEFPSTQQTVSFCGLDLTTDYGLELKKIDPPSIEKFQNRVEQRSGGVELTMEDVDRLVHDARK